MTIFVTCWKCRNNFTTSDCGSIGLCDDCNGTNEAKRQEEERWKALTVEQKLDELRQLVLSLHQRQSWDGRIG